MKSTLRISLKSGEKIFINGAVLRVDRKVALEFLNDVTFLLENHVLQPEQATTPLRQLYFIAQMILINPEGREQSTNLFRKSVSMLLNCFQHEEILAELKRIDGLVAVGKALSDRGENPQQSGNDPRNDRTDSQGDSTMAVDAVSSAASNPWANAGASSSDKNAASLNYDSFLKLLITQMKHQDPTSPMDAGQQMSQLASFSQVEQTIKTNTHLKSMLQAEALTRASDLVGKTVRSADDKVTGVVKEVEVYSDGVVAITEAGDKVLLQAGVTFSNGPITSIPTGGTDSNKPAGS
jgi:flagellar basal-body rod modification protein FlgD